MVVPVSPKFDEYAKTVSVDVRPTACPLMYSSYRCANSYGRLDFKWRQI